MPSTDYSKIKNTLERRATMIVELLNDRAQHIVDAMDEPPPGTQAVDAAQVRAMWTFSPFGDRAPYVYWQLHDLALQSLMGEIGQMPNLSAADRIKMVRAAHQKAEMAALAKAYPHRAALILLGATTPERSVQLAERAASLAKQDVGKPEAAPAEVTAYG
jgi:hypothetical protein